MTPSLQDLHHLRPLLAGKRSLEALSGHQMTQAFLEARSLPEPELAPLLAQISAGRAKREVALSLTRAPHPALIGAFLQAHGSQGFAVLNLSANDKRSALDHVRLNRLTTGETTAILAALAGAEASSPQKIHAAAKICQNRADWRTFKEFVLALGVPRRAIAFDLNVLISTQGLATCQEMCTFCADIFDETYHHDAPYRTWLIAGQASRPNLHLQALLLIKGAPLGEGEDQPSLDMRKRLYSWTVPLYECLSSNHGKLALYAQFAGLDTRHILSLGQEALADLLYSAIDRTRGLISE